MKASTALPAAREYKNMALDRIRLLALRVAQEANEVDGDRDGRHADENEAKALILALGHGGFLDEGKRWRLSEWIEETRMGFAPATPSIFGAKE